MADSFQLTGRHLGPALHAAAATSIIGGLLVPDVWIWKLPVIAAFAALAMIGIGYILLRLRQPVEYGNRIVERIARQLPIHPVIKARQVVWATWLCVLIGLIILGVIFIALNMAALNESQQKFSRAGGTITERMSDDDQRLVRDITFSAGTNRLSTEVFDYLSAEYDTIERLNLENSNVRGPMLAHLDDVEIGELLLAGLSELDNESLQSLAGLRIRRLVLDHSPWLTDAGMAYVAQIPTLESLSVRSCPNISHVGFQQLERAHLLEELSIDRNAQLDGRLFDQLAPGSLRRLIAHDVPLTDDDFKTIAKHPIEVLRLRESPITDEGLKTLATIPLRTLELIESPRWSPEGLTALEIATLTDVNLSRSAQLTDQGVDNLLNAIATSSGRTSAQIDRLILNDCDRLTGGIADILIGHDFKEIELLMCSNLDDDAIEKLKAHFKSRLKISTGFETPQIDG